MIAVKLLCLDIGVTHITTERDALVLRLDSERSLSPQAVKRLQFEAPTWRSRGLPAPAFAPERITIFTHNVGQDVMLSLLEQVADRLRVIEQEVLRNPRPASTVNTRREFGGRPFGR